MRKLFSTHWCNHDELLRRLARKPEAYLSLAYWVGRHEVGAPVFFITEGEKPNLRRDLRFATWQVTGLRRLNHPAEAESILTQWDDQATAGALVKVPYDVHWNIQFSPTDRQQYGPPLPEEEEEQD